MQKAFESLKTPYADLLPPLSTDEFEALRADIEANGVRDPIIVDEDGNILDGHHRYRICPDAPVRVVSGLSEAEKLAFVLRANLTRRNLSPEQKRELQKTQRKIAFQLKAEQRWTQEQIARLLGVDRGTIARWLDNSQDTNKVITNVRAHNSYTPLDCRVKIPPKLHPVILERIERGEPQTKVAADLKVSQVAIHKIVAKERRRREVSPAAPRDDRDAKTPKLLGTYDSVEIRRGDFREVLADIPDGSVDLILTDPPYGKAYLDLWDALGAFAARKLKRSGLLISYAGQLYLPSVIAALCKHLRWWWMSAVIHAGPGKLTPLDHPVRKVINRWKPLLILFPDGGFGFESTFEDLLDGAGPSKRSHNWEQPATEAEEIIRTFCPQNGLVVDPFAGSGSFGIAARNAGCRFIGAEILDA